MVSRYVLGEPFNTEIIEDKIEVANIKDIKFLNIIKDEVGYKLSCSLDDKDKVFGLGENMRGINKRGFIYESFCSDDPNHAPDKRSLYGAHNFFIVDGKEKFGVYIDYSSKVIFDVGYSKSDELVVSIDNENFEIYIIEGENLRAITKNFLAIIGKSYLPPKWAFGYIQSRWSYPTGEAVEEIADEFIKRDIPCDGICLDLDYMDDYKDFSLSDERFKDFDKLTGRLKEKGVKIIPIIDAGVKLEEGYDIYDEGIEHDYFTVDKDGKPFVAAVWPGKVHFPDFLNSDARVWFGKKYKILTDKGVEGFWNDMNEPAIFYSENRLKKAYEKIDELRQEELNIDSFFALKDTILGLSNSLEDYKAMYHKTENGLVNHYDVHNLYGYNMTKAAAQGFDEIEEDKRFLLFSRASSIGMHRYGGIWTGDNCSWWEHLRLNIHMMPSLNMCGFIYSGADTGGFGSNAEAELITRWNQFSIFAPLYRNHAAMGTRNQEPFAFDEKTQNIVKDTIQFRYAMLPYMYSEFMKATNSSDMLIAPLCFEYNDEMSKNIEDQLLIGDSIMVTPVYEANKRGRYVYLPEDMLLWKVKNYKEKNLEVIKKGHHYIDINIDEFAMFIRKDKMFVYGEHAQNIEKINGKELSVVAYVDNIGTYILYDDNGISKNTVGSNLEIEIRYDGNDFEVTVENNGNEIIEKINFTIKTTDGKEFEQSIKI